MSTIQLPTPIYVALEVDKLNNFTISECLKSGYGTERNSYSNANGYNYIYIQVMKLVEQGLLTKKSRGRYISFIKTAEYENSTIEVCAIEKGEKMTWQTDVLLQLKKRYRDYESQIQSLWGERREYDDLVIIYPQLSDTVNTVSGQIYEEINLMSGRINAIMGVIKAVSKGQTQ
ncbi:hypothetical protein D3C77_59540 [compost metagenome]